MLSKTNRRGKRCCQQKHSARGFTIIELVLVFAIIATIAVVSVAALNYFINSANEESALSQATLGHASLQSIASDAYLHEGTYQRADGSQLENILTMPAGTEGTVSLQGEPSISNELDRLTASQGYILKSWDVKEGTILSFALIVPCGVVVEYDGSEYKIVS